jgi:hypothetical protein
MKNYKDHINMFLSKLGYSELVQRLFEKMTFFLVDTYFLPHILSPSLEHFCCCTVAISLEISL